MNMEQDQSTFSFALCAVESWWSEIMADLKKMEVKCCEKCKYSDLDYIFDNKTGKKYPFILAKRAMMLV